MVFDVAAILENVAFPLVVSAFLMYICWKQNQTINTFSVTVQAMETSMKDISRTMEDISHRLERLEDRVDRIDN